MNAPAQAFGSSRSELPILYVLLGLGSVELLVVHLVVSLWSTTAAWVLSAATLLFIVQFAMVVHRLKRSPTLLTEDRLMIRSGKGFEVSLPWNKVASVEPIGLGSAPSGEDVLRVSLLAHPNILVTATEPFTVKRFGRSRLARSAALRVDQPAALVSAARRMKHGAVGST